MNFRDICKVSEVCGGVLASKLEACLAEQKSTQIFKVGKQVQRNNVYFQLHAVRINPSLENNKEKFNLTSQPKEAAWNNHNQLVALLARA